MSQAPKNQLVKYQQGKEKFEIITKPGMTLKFREGKIGFNKVLVVDQVFTNSVRGDVANQSVLERVFGTNKMDEILKKIVLEGDLQYSTQERKEMLENKKKEIIYYIHKNYQDPKTKLPHPPDRISNGMKQSKINVDINKDTVKQAEEAVKKMRGKLMFEKAAVLYGKLTIKFSYHGNCNNIIHSKVTVVKEKWNDIGCVYTIEATKSGLDQLTSALNKPTNGGDFTFVSVDNFDDKKGPNNNQGGSNNKKRRKKRKEKQKNESKNANDNSNTSGENSNKSSKNKNKKKKNKKKDNNQQS